ncbi:glycosyltransferase [Peptostreptococcus equinus]|uniref:Glycosyltransferase n=1 Tax=Peptostreptococcus equinus TaxID=3003601 RepID=A0ABY7JLC7_9FIRM|nr:glycosyltransferase [Peptostreptococcus sp. CBA3647]WAW14155.1 glycosyltransferase [Peptostreptococcus sp. CBA3647]
MKNIAIIITKLNGGGAERCASNLSIELSKYYNVFIMPFDNNNITYPYEGELLDINILPANGSFAKLFNIAKRVRKISYYKKKYKIDCTISLLDGPNIVNVLSKSNDKTIISIRNYISKEPMSKMRRFFIEYCNKHADYIIALSNMVKKDLIENYKAPVTNIDTIYNHCDAHLLSNEAKSAINPLEKNNKFKFVTMGRLSNQKGQWHLLRSFKKVANNCSDAELIILGEGELENELKALAKNLDIENKVKFLGFLKNPHNVVKSCQVFVFPSLYEGLGNVLLESLAMEMPIISSDCIAGPKEVLGPNLDLNEVIKNKKLAQYGILVPVCDGEHFNSEDDLTHEENELADSMILMYNDEELRNKYINKSRIRILDFDKDKIISEWKEKIDFMIN